MAVVEFSPTEFRSWYPQFTPDKVTDGQLEQAFNVACLILNNTDASPAPYDPDKGVYDRKTLLYMLVCHLTTLGLRGASGQAGPVASAAEGSVNVSFAVPTITGKTADWYIQTPCGQAFWTAIRKYMVGGLYVPGCKFHPWG